MPAGAGRNHCFSSGVHSEEEMPFGGVKASGYGRFGGKTGVVELQSCDGSALRPPRSTARSDLPSWAVNETCLKVHGRWCYLSRTVDRSGTLVDVLFSEHRNMAIAQAFFRSATAVTRACKIVGCSGGCGGGAAAVRLEPESGPEQSAQSPEPGH